MTNVVCVHCNSTRDVEADGHVCRGCLSNELAEARSMAAELRSMVGAIEQAMADIREGRIGA